jgi:hypothetical protein
MHEGQNRNKRIKRETIVVSRRACACIALEDVRKDRDKAR